jgi:photosystem II stability/assembly factor-like uncharacterized protein
MRAQGHSTPSPTAFSTKAAPGQLAFQPLWALAAVLLLLMFSLGAWRQAPRPNALVRPASIGWLNWLLFPVEVNAALRLPAAPGRLNDVWVHGARNTVWAAGGAGTVMISTDGGQTWSAQATGVKDDLNAIAFTADGLHGWVAGDQGTILNTVDGGRTWAAQPAIASVKLRSTAASASGMDGVIVGDDGAVLRTTDGGAHWLAQAKGNSASLKGTTLSQDGATTWVVDSAGTIESFTNDDRGFTKSTVATNKSLAAIAFAKDGQRGWAVGADGILMSSTDGGQSWHQENAGTPSDLKGLWVSSDAQRLVLVGSHGALLSTKDGGDHWATVTTNTGEYILAVAFAADEVHGWAVGTGGLVMATSDGGETWLAQTHAGTSRLSAIAFTPDGMKGWTASGAGHILATTDGGTRWFEQDSGTQAYLNSVHALPDGQHVWVAGDDGTLLTTNDGGKHWAAVKSGVAADLSAVTFTQENQKGWVTGAGGTLLGTTDGGRTWTARDDGLISGDLTALGFTADGSQGWIVGEEGHLLHSTDGGATWAQMDIPTTHTLTNVAFDQSGKQIWAVGEGDTLLRSQNGGLTWARPTQQAFGGLYTIAATPDGRTLLAAGSGGAVWRSEDGGEHWRQQDTKVGSPRTALWTSADGQRAWAVGYPPALLRTEDAGQSWQPMPWPLRYQRYPAPWYALSLLMVLAVASRAVHRQPSTILGAATIGASDAPAQDFESDRLQFGPLARGLSRFLRNPATEPPLTVAISGDWGTGKSSLMNLVCRDLERHGCRPIWFNAWHHQKDDHLLPALLGAIAQQGLPPLLSLDGLAFRLRLLLARSLKHYMLTLALLTVMTMAGGFLATHSEADRAWLSNRLTQLGSNSDSNGKAFGSKAETLGKAAQAADTSPDKSFWLALCLSASGALGGLIALYRAFKAFGVDPAVLVAGSAEVFKLKDAEAATNFRARFAPQFKDVTAALPYRTVIVIDDLDRCHPDAVLTVMEAVNFLVSSGSCMVIFGMAVKRVQAALGLSFDKIAKELVELDLGAENTTSIGQADADRACRRRYAQDYLEKLINLEVQVPARTDLPAHKLLVPQAQPERKAWQAAWQGLAPLMPLAVLAMVLPLAWVIGTMPQIQKEDAAIVATEVAPSPKGMPTAPDTSKPTVAQGVQTEQNRVVLQAGPASVQPNAVRQYVPVVQQPAPDARMSVAWILLPASLMLLALSSFTLMRLRQSTRTVHDSPDFMQALEAWAPLVRAHRQTPRAVKRFGNRVRYLAMLQQAESLDESGWDVWLDKLANAWLRLNPWRDRGAPAPDTPAPRPMALAEHRIVALGAIHEAFGIQWRQALVPDADGQLPLGEDPIAAGVYQQSVAAYMRSMNTHWPPEEEELDVFARALQGVRLPGDPELLAGSGPGGLLARASASSKASASFAA